MSRKNRTIRRGSPHKDPMNVEINRLSKLGGLAADIALDPITFRNWRKRKVPAKKKRPSPH